MINVSGSIAATPFEACAFGSKSYTVMKIYELPYEIRKHVFTLQIEAGNRPDASLDLVTKVTDGNFDWHKTPQGFPFWRSINEGWYKTFYKQFPNPEYLDHPQNLSLADHLAEQVIKECSINLSENSQNDLKATINKVFDGYSIEACFHNRHEIIDSYKMRMREHVSGIADQILNKDFYYEEDGQKYGFSVMLRKFISEKVELDNSEIDSIVADLRSEKLTSVTAVSRLQALKK